MLFWIVFFILYLPLGTIAKLTKRYMSSAPFFNGSRMQCMAESDVNRICLIIKIKHTRGALNHEMAYRF